jgi:acetyl esterase/lipase
MPGFSTGQPEVHEPIGNDGVLRIKHVSRPTLALCPPTKSGAPAPCVIVCPGGAYHGLAYNKEGNEVAAWLNSIGLAAAILKYRVPDNREGAFQDVQRAARLIRGNATAWNIDPAKIGILGFSAGGHLGARLCAHSSDKTYPAFDRADELSAEVDFAILVYPAYLETGGKPSPEFENLSEVPPTLIVHAEDDLAHVPSGKIYYAALQEAKISSRFLLYAAGGHGYGLRSDLDVRVWPQETEKWLEEIGVIGS